MELRDKKLPIEASDSLRGCPVSAIKPFQVMLTPVYVFMKLNKKFISVKRPLDFFTEEEIKRYQTYETFFVPPFVDSLVPFSLSGRRVRALLEMAERVFEQGEMPPAPYELSDAVLQMIGPLWAEDTQIEPFFVAVFVAELCGGLRPNLISESREKDVDGFERAFLASAWATFVLLHLGYNDLNYLIHFREQAFLHYSKSSTAFHARFDESAEVVRAADKSLGDGFSVISGYSLFRSLSGRVAEKMASRLFRVKTDLVIPGSVPVSLFGERGIIDA